MTLNDKETVEDEEKIIHGKLNFNFDLQELATWLKAFGKPSIKKSVIHLKLNNTILHQLGGNKSNKLSFEIDQPGNLKIVSNDSRLLHEFVPIINGWLLMFGNCIKCGGCLKQCKDITLSDEKLYVKKQLNVDTIKLLFGDCPVHPQGVRNQIRTLAKEYSPTSCTACFMNYKKDMAYIDPGNVHTNNDVGA